MAEVLGDKSIYTIGSLAARFRPISVGCGLALAFMAKMLAAVLFGRIIAELPTSFVVVTSTATFLLTALTLWLKRDERSVLTEEPVALPKATLVTFAAVFFSEWGDVGQITAATLTARYQLPMIIWVGATLALMTKGLLAMLLGRGLRRYLPNHVLRPLSITLCVVLAIISAIGPMFH
jgi:Ca2+/H+ antiporter, TMEM165/GDT1 family